MSRDIIKVMAGTFLGEGGNPKDPLANPLHADLRGLPPVYIQVGGDETLLDDSRAAGRNARKAGVDVTVDVFPEHAARLPLPGRRRAGGRRRDQEAG